MTLGRDSGDLIMPDPDEQGETWGRFTDSTPALYHSTVPWASQAHYSARSQLDYVRLRASVHAQLRQPHSADNHRQVPNRHREADPTAPWIVVG